MIAGIILPIILLAGAGSFPLIMGTWAVYETIKAKGENNEDNSPN